MNTQILDYDLELSIDGIGIVFYSNDMTNHILEGCNFLENEFMTPKQVSDHIRKGDIVAFNTGSAGDYTIKLRSGYPDKLLLEQYPINIRLGLEVRGGVVSFIDLFWLSEWSSICPKEQQVKINDGFYEISVCTQIPKSGMYGDKQEIFIFFEKVDSMPKLAWNGVPSLFV